MPRPDKQINSGGRLDGPASSSRGVSWTKHAGPEGLRGAPSTLEVTVDDITIVETADAPTTDDAAPDVSQTGQLSKWDQRGTAAHIPTDDVLPVAEPVMEWLVLRTIEGRTYRRTDALTAVPADTES